MKGRKKERKRKEGKGRERKRKEGKEDTPSLFCLSIGTQKMLNADCFDSTTGTTRLYSVLEICQCQFSHALVSCNMTQNKSIDTHSRSLPLQYHLHPSPIHPPIWGMYVLPWLDNVSSPLFPLVHRRDGHAEDGIHNYSCWARISFSSLRAVSDCVAQSKRKTVQSHTHTPLTTQTMPCFSALFFSFFVFCFLFSVFFSFL